MIKNTAECKYNIRVVMYLLDLALDILNNFGDINAYNLWENQASCFLTSYNISENNKQLAKDIILRKNKIDENRINSFKLFLGAIDFTDIDNLEQNIDTLERISCDKISAKFMRELFEISDDRI